MMTLFILVDNEKFLHAGLHPLMDFQSPSLDLAMGDIYPVTVIIHKSYSSTSIEGASSP
jgi:hypothetical protein